MPVITVIASQQAIVRNYKYTDDLFIYFLKHLANLKKRCRLQNNGSFVVILYFSSDSYVREIPSCHWIISLQAGSTQPQETYPTQFKKILM